MPQKVCLQNRNQPVLRVRCCRTNERTKKLSVTQQSTAARNIVPMRTMLTQAQHYVVHSRGMQNFKRLLVEAIWDQKIFFKSRVSIFMKEWTAPGGAQGDGTACRCMCGTVSLCHVALSKDTRLLVRVRPCGPPSTIFDRRSRSRMSRADTNAAA